MKRFYGLALVAVIAAAPVSLEAQTPRAPQGQEQAGRGQRPAPISRILEQRAALGLSAEQVSRLEAIQQRLQQQNAPLIEQLRASGAWQERGQNGERGQQRGPGARGERQIPEELRPVMQQLRENNRTAMQQVQEVLTAEQRARLRELMQQHRRGEGRGARPGR